MKVLSLILIQILFVPSIMFGQQIYKWKDEKGQWHFTHSPPTRRQRSSEAPVVNAGIGDPKIENYCKRIVGDSYSLMETCIKGEKAAKDKLDRRSTDPKIFSYCQRIVGDSYSLMETCIKSEEDAKRRLGH